MKTFFCHHHYLEIHFSYSVSNSSNCYSLFYTLLLHAVDVRFSLNPKYPTIGLKRDDLLSELMIIARCKNGSYFRCYCCFVCILQCFLLFTVFSSQCFLLSMFPPLQCFRLRRFLNSEKLMLPSPLRSTWTQNIVKCKSSIIRS